MLHLIIGWLLFLVGVGVAGMAVRAWFNGSVYLPSQNTMAIVVGVLLAIAGIVIVLVL